MPPILQYNTVSQKEAYLNEFKGNLFEFLVASILAKKRGIEGKFLKSFSGDLRSQFSHYELQLRREDSELVKKLGHLSMELAEELIKLLPSTIRNILIIGKSPGWENWKEADILVEYDGGKIPISIKLCKERSFVNTKSGGVSSFFTKYFSNFFNISIFQERLDECVQKGFLKMGHQLYDYYGLEFEGRFDESWNREVGVSLPGELPPKPKEYLYQYYFEVIQSKQWLYRFNSL